MRPDQLERVPVRAFWQWECPWCEGTVDTEWYGGMMPPVIVTCDDCGGRAVADGFLFGPGSIDHLDGPVPGPSREVADPGNGASPVVAGSRVEPATNATLADDERLAIRDAWSELPLRSPVEHGYGDDTDCLCGRNFAKVRGLREHITKARATRDDERLAIRDAWSELPLLDGLDVGDTDQD